MLILFYNFLKGDKKMKNKVKEILEKFREKAFLKKCIDFFKTNWKKVALIVGVVIVVTVIGTVSHSIRVNNIKNNVINQLSGKTFENFEELGMGGWTLNSYTFQEDGKYIEDIYYYYNRNSDTIEHKSYDGTADIKVSLFGKVTFSVYEVVLNNGEIEALKSSISDDTYEIVEISHLQKIAVDVFCELTQWKNSNYGEMIEIIYKDYDVTCEVVEGSKTKYLLTFDGEYYPNKKDVPDFTCTGTLAVEVDIEEKTGKIIKDEGVTDAMDVYLILSQFG